MILQSIKRAAQRRSAPYLVSILLGASGWAIVHTVDRVTSVPAVEYGVEWTQHNEKRTVTIQFENISYTTRFTKLEFGFVSTEKEGVFSCPYIDPRAPAYVGRRVDGNVIPSQPQIVGGHELRIPIADLQPGEKYVVTATYSGADNPVLQLRQAGSELLLLERSITTLLVKNETVVLVILVTFALGIVALLLGRGGAETGHDEEGP